MSKKNVDSSHHCYKKSRCVLVRKQNFHLEKNVMQEFIDQLDPKELQNGYFQHDSATAHTPQISSKFRINIWCSFVFVHHVQLFVNDTLYYYWSIMTEWIFSAWRRNSSYSSNKLKLSKEFYDTCRSHTDASIHLDHLIWHL